MIRALVVDDNNANRMLVVEILRGLIECDEAATGREAIDKFKEAFPVTPYDLVLLDIGMPDINGLTVLFEMRQVEQASGKPLLKQTPVIIVTAYKKLSTETQRLGCDDYLIKPVSSDVLIRSIEKLLGPLTPSS